MVENIIDLREYNSVLETNYSQEEDEQASEDRSNLDSLDEKVEKQDRGITSGEDIFIRESRKSSLMPKTSDYSKSVGKIEYFSFALPDNDYYPLQTVFGSPSMFSSHVLGNYNVVNHIQRIKSTTGPEVEATGYHEKAHARGNRKEGITEEEGQEDMGRKAA